MKEFSDIIKAIRDSAHADGPCHSVTQNVGYAVCGHPYSNTELFDEICDKLEEAHKKELEDMRRDVADVAEEAKNFMVAQVVSSYKKQLEAIMEECDQKVRYLMGGTPLDNDVEICKVNELEDELTLQKATNFANADTIIELSNDYADLVAERNGILDLLRDAAEEYEELLDKYLAVPWEDMQPMDDEHMSRLGWMRALDADGVPIRMGDTVRYDEEDVPFVGEPFEVEQITHFRDGSCYVVGGSFDVNAKSVRCTHQEPKPDPIEQTIRELTIGNITETEAIERLHEISGS